MRRLWLMCMLVLLLAWVPSCKEAEQPAPKDKDVKVQTADVIPVGVAVPVAVVVPDPALVSDVVTGAAPAPAVDVQVQVQDVAIPKQSVSPDAVIQKRTDSAGQSCDDCRTSYSNTMPTRRSGVASADLLGARG